MKLYATIENEKGKKEGMGGSEYLDIDIRVGNQLLTSFTLRKGASPDTDKEAWILYDESDEPINWIENTSIGKRGGEVIEPWDIKPSDNTLFKKGKQEKDKLQKYCSNC